MEPTAFPTYRSPAYQAAVQAMAAAHAPHRFAVAGHDPRTKNTAIIGWGLDYGDDDILIESTLDDRSWHLKSPEHIRIHFPDVAPDDIEIIWIDPRSPR